MTRCIRLSEGSQRNREGLIGSLMAKHDDPDVLLTANEASRFLRIHLVTLYTWAIEGRIPSIKLGRRRLFSRQALDRWLETSAHPAREISRVQG